MKITPEELKYKQSRPLSEKIEMSQCIIETWWKHWNGQVYVAFSGGKDSTVLLHLVRSIFPDISGVFSDTGLEYPEIKDFVKTTTNVEIIRPKKSYRQIIDKYGYPVISKNVSMGLSRFCNTKSEEQRHLRLFGGINPSSGKYQHPSIPKKYHYLKDAPFKISERCCDQLKKYPFKVYYKKTKKVPYIGLMASDSFLRRGEYLKFGCNVFDSSIPSSRPLMFWNSDDVWEYIKTYDISYCKIYDTGISRTGCMWCMFGAHLESEPNRFQQMKISHPKIWNYAINDLGLGNVLDYINVPYE